MKRRTLWHGGGREAEGERNAVAMVEEHNTEHTDRWGPMTLQPGMVDEKRARVDEARKRALPAGVRGVRKSDPVLPGTAYQLKAINEPAAIEAHTYGYRPTGWDTHAGARSFIYSAFVERNDGAQNRVDPLIHARLNSQRGRPVQLHLGIVEFAQRIHVTLGEGVHRLAHQLHVLLRHRLLRQAHGSRAAWRVRWSSARITNPSWKVNMTTA